MLLQKHICTGGLLPQSVFRVEAMVAPGLTGGIGDQIYAAGGYPDPQIEADLPIQTVIQHTGGIDAPVSSAHINDTNFHKMAPPYKAKTWIFQIHCSMISEK